MGEEVSDWAKSTRIMVFHRDTLLRPIFKSIQTISHSHLSKPHSIAAMSTISRAVIEDHRELEQFYNEVVSNGGNADHQQRYGNQFVWELARHSVGEELVLYPAMERHLGAKGKEMADHDRKEHHEVGASPIDWGSTHQLLTVDKPRSRRCSRSSRA